MDCSGIPCRTFSISSLSSAGRNQMKEPDMRLIGIRSVSPGTKSFWACSVKTVRADKTGTVRSSSPSSLDGGRRAASPDGRVLFEVVQKVWPVNAQRQQLAPGHRFSGKSSSAVAGSPVPEYLSCQSNRPPDKGQKIIRRCRGDRKTVIKIYF